MYVVERLMQEFPNYAAELSAYDEFLTQHHSGPETTKKIFDDQKENFHFIHDAYAHLNECGNHDHDFNKLMADYEKSFNDDWDFMAYFCHKFYDKNCDGMSLEDIKNFVNQKIFETDKLLAKAKEQT